MTKVFVDNDEMLRHYRSMIKTSTHRPTKLELAILGVLWQDGPATVREVLARLNKTQETGYTTVLKMLQIMTEKQLVVRDETTRPQVYRARNSREKTQRQLLKDLMQRAFGGSVRTLVMQAVSTKKSSPEDLEAMERLLDRFEGGTK